jgi:aubergine-like protein
MVNTKNSERFFTLQKGNVQAGTLISEGLVSVNYDFFMVSQQPMKGSSVPNHYRVIYSNSAMEEGVLQELCFSQCFNYVNWTGSIKVPAILQYAKKCAKFHAEVLDDAKVAEAVQNRMYFV